MTATAYAVTQGLKGTFPVPGDKSISHRSLIFSALSDGQTEIFDILESEDILCTADALSKMGVVITKRPDTDKAGQNVYVVTGANLQNPETPLYLGNSGTSARLLSGVIAGQGVTACLTGDDSLSQRPMGRVSNPLTQMGAVFRQEDTASSLPLWVESCSALQAIDYDMPVSSAQIKSAILFAGLCADGVTTVTDPGKSRDHTERMMKAYGLEIDISEQDDGRQAVSVTGGGVLQTPERIVVPADPSSAAFPAVAAILYEGSDIVLPNICMNPTRAGLYSVLKDMGADIVFENMRDVGGEPVADIHVRYNGALKGVMVGKEVVPSMIDEYPILAVAASFAKGTTRMQGLEELRVKESNRLEKIAAGLLSCGVQAEIDGDDLIVHGTDGAAPEGGAQIATGFDHRIAMSFLVLGGKTQKPVTIDAPDAIATSFPNFIADMTALGCDIRL